MVKLAFLILILISVARLSYGKQAKKAQKPCSWLDDNSIGKKSTDPKIIAACDDKSFKVIDYYLALDKDFVYCKPMPNASNFSTRIEGADPATFRRVNESHSVDKKCVYKFCEVLVGIDPKTFDPKTFNFSGVQKTHSKCE